MIVLKEWCAGGKFRLKKSYHTQLARTKVQIMTGVYLEKVWGIKKLLRKKNTSKKAARERRGEWEYNSNIVFLLKDVHYFFP